jgi:transcription elongation factor/antiterminator RfaH
MTDAAWYAVQTKPRCEERVISRLRDQRSLSVFLPKMEILRKRRSRRVAVIEPLFPSYLFVQMRLEPDPWHAVKWTPGVKRIVGTGETPTPVPPEAIDLLMTRCGDGHVIQRRFGMRHGDTVRVVYGPFTGLEGILDRPTSRGERVRVLLRLLGSTTAVELDITDVERVA